MYMYTCMYIHAHIFIIIICAYLAGLPQLTISSPDAFNAFLIDRNVRSKTLDEVVLGATRRANLEGRPTKSSLNWFANVRMFRVQDPNCPSFKSPSIWWCKKRHFGMRRKRRCLLS